MAPEVNGDSISVVNINTIDAGLAGHAASTTHRGQAINAAKHHANLLTAQLQKTLLDPSLRVLLDSNGGSCCK